VVYYSRYETGVTENLGYGATPTLSSGTPPTQSNVQAKFASNSMLHPAGGNVDTRSNLILGGANNTDYAFGTEDFTAECWIYITSISDSTSSNHNYSVLSFTHTAGATNRIWLLQFNSSNQLFNHAFYDGAAYSPPAVYFGYNTWTHISIGRQGTQLYSSVNGVVTATNTSAASIGTATGTQIGNDSNQQNNYTAYYDDFRITRGFARYTSNFTPSAKAFPTPLLA
jgi:hypothetical protein